MRSEFYIVKILLVAISVNHMHSYISESAYLSIVSWYNQATIYLVCFFQIDERVYNDEHNNL